MELRGRGHLAVGRKQGWLYLAKAFALLSCGYLPAAANAAAPNAALEQSEAPDMVAWHDRESRVLHIGASHSPPTPGEPILVTINRASDLVGQPLKIAHRPWSRVGTRNGLPLSGALPTGMPLAATSLTSGFGMRTHPLLGTRRQHNGLDMAARAGSAIVATSDGVVSMADWNGGYGLYVALDHGRGIQTRYGHMSRLNVAAGARVRKGDVIGYVGSTGRSTGPHLHYEVRVNGQAINPAQLLKR